MHGQLSEEQLSFIRKLEARIDSDSSPTEDVLRLARLYIEPLHQEDKAAELLREILQREPNNNWARYWLAHCCVYYFMDPDSLGLARQLLEACIRNDPTKSAAMHSLLASVLRDLGEPITQQYLRLLEESARLEPKWVLNRICLAQAYETLGRFKEATQQLELAADNLVEWQLLQRNLESTVQGFSELSLEDIRDRLKRLSSRPSPT